MELDYGPLNTLIGKWQGDQGMDIAPESDGIERNPYYETIEFTPIGDVTNAEEQELVGLFYQQIVDRKSNQQTFHHQSGYVMWNHAEQKVFYSLTIPRAVAVVAEGTATVDDEKTSFSVKTMQAGGIAESEFMQTKAKTLSFEMDFAVQGDELSYNMLTMLEIYGKEFKHKDKNTLRRVS